MRRADKRAFSCGIVAALGALGLSGCGPSVGVLLTGMPRAPRPADCAIEFVSLAPADTAPGGRFGSGGEYEQLGMVSVGAGEGVDALSAPIRGAVRPKACAIGGEVAAIQRTGLAASQRGGEASLVFTIWAKQPGAAP